MQFFMLQLTCPTNSPKGNCCFLVGPKDTYWNRVGEERQKNRFRKPKRCASSSSLVTSPGSAMETPDKPATMATKELLCPSVMENAMQVVWDMEHDSGSRQPDLPSQLSCLHGPELHVGRVDCPAGPGVSNSIVQPLSLPMGANLEKSISLEELAFAETQFDGDDFCVSAACSSFDAASAFASAQIDDLSANSVCSLKPAFDAAAAFADTQVDEWELLANPVCSFKPAFDAATAFADTQIDDLSANPVCSFKPAFDVPAAFADTQVDECELLANPVCSFNRAFDAAMPFADTQVGVAPTNGFGLSACPSPAVDAPIYEVEDGVFGLPMFPKPMLGDELV